MVVTDRAVQVKIIWSEAIFPLDISAAKLFPPRSLLFGVPGPELCQARPAPASQSPAC